jgi:radical SAM superfamily enzyme YgiQ (UPF0313 family)
MKKILLIGINCRYTHTNLALRYLREISSSSPHKIVLREFTINQQFLDILSNIVTSDADIIAFSVYIWNSNLIKMLLSELKKIKPGVKFILGGPEAGYNPEKWLAEFPFIDYIITGSGERSWKYLQENSFELPEKVISLPVEDFSEIPFPYSEAEFAELENKYIYYEASRGCSFKCSYCLSSRSDQKLLRNQLQRVKQELDFFCSKDIKIVKFVDRTFNADPQYARAIWNYLREKETSIKFHFEIHPSLLQPEDFELLSKIPEGRFQFEIGIQSVNPATLTSINRFTEWNKIKANINKILELKNIHVHVDLITGLPFEDFASMKNSFNEVHALNAEHFQLGFLKLLPGTELDEKKNEFDIKHTSEPPYEVLSTKWMNFSQIDHFRRLSKLLDSFYNTEHFKTTLPELISLQGSAYEFYDFFYRSYFINHPDDISRNWQLNGACLTRLIKDNFSTQREFLLDCLRWDWCRYASSHYYPDFLQSSLLAEAKVKGRKILLSDYPSIFPKNEMNKAIYFQSENDNFKQKYLSGFNFAVFSGKRLLLKFN